MLRNHKEEKLKELRRLHRHRDEMWELGRKVEYITLEKPQFCGWNISVDFTQDVKRRKDINVLEAVLDRLTLRKPRFTRRVKYIKLIRRENYKYDTLNFKYLDYILDGLYNRYINKYTYHNAPPSVKHYFKEVKDGWSKRYGDYELNRDLWRNPFPFEKLRLKVSKAYYTHMTIPNDDAKAEGDYCHLILKQNHYFSGKYGFNDGWRSTKDYIINRRIRVGWRSFLSQVRIGMDIEEEFEAFSKTKIHRRFHKQFRS